MTLIAKLLGALMLMTVVASAHANLRDQSKFPTTPTLNGNSKWRIAYYEGGSHDNYLEYLVATTRGLMELGWIEKERFPEVVSGDTKSFWEWARSLDSDYIEFVADGYYSARWSTDYRNQVREQIIDRLRSAHDIDLIIAMGTWAGKDLANDQHSVPTIVMSTSDPLKSGIIRSITDSGNDHVHARVDPRRYERQVRVFHDIVQFRKLGLAYEDSVDGRTYAAVDLVARVARERGFEVVKCYTKSDISERSIARQSVVDCFRRLAKEVDAIYVTIQGGVNVDSIPQLVQIANAYRIPTFSQLGSKEVEQGFLLSISRPNFKPVGLFLAATISKVFNGARPRQLDQLFEETPNIAINLKTAEMIGLYLYADILAAADEIYHEIPGAR